MEDLEKVGSFMFKFKHVTSRLRKSDDKLIAKIKTNDSFKLFIAVVSVNMHAIRLLSYWFRDSSIRRGLVYLLDNFDE